jgi:2-methylisocitrate lyase-like PEP mutase family enzyme
VTSFDDAMDRAATPRRRGGRDLPEAMQARGAGEVRGEVKSSAMANMTEFGKTPLLPLAGLARLGYRMIYPRRPCVAFDRSRTCLPT